jgi:hypothetical protein
VRWSRRRQTDTCLKIEPQLSIGSGNVLEKLTGKGAAVFYFVCFLFRF